MDNSWKLVQFLLHTFHLIMTPLVYDPTTFTPRKGLLTRYAKKMLRPEFYGRIFVSNLNTL